MIQQTKNNTKIPTRIAILTTLKMGSTHFFLETFFNYSLCLFLFVKKLICQYLTHVLISVSLHKQVQAVFSSCFNDTTGFPSGNHSAVLIVILWSHDQIGWKIMSRAEITLEKCLFFYVKQHICFFLHEGCFIYQRCIHVS